MSGGSIKRFFAPVVEKLLDPFGIITKPRDEAVEQAQQQQRVAAAAQQQAAATEAENARLKAEAEKQKKATEESAAAAAAAVAKTSASPGIDRGQVRPSGFYRTTRRASATPTLGGKATPGLSSLLGGS